MARRRQPSSLNLIPFIAIIVAAFSVRRSRCGGVDMQALLAFKASSDGCRKLSSWNENHSNPCSGEWVGVSCTSNRVTRLVLENQFLSGTGFHILANTLDQLRVLSLKHNSLSGELPDLSKLTALKLLFLSHNNFSGEIPSSISSLTRLYRLDLSSNFLSGEIPTKYLNKLTHLLTFRINRNKISGTISNLHLRNIQDLNVSSNLLNGTIPASLAVFPASVFQGNPGICGPPVSSECSSVDALSDPTKPGGSTTFTPTSPAATAVVSSSPGSKPPEFVVTKGTAKVAPHKEGRMSRVAVVAIVVGDFVVLLLVSGLLFCYFWKKYSGHRRSRLQEGEKVVYSTSPYAAAGGGNAIAGAGVSGGFDSGKMAFFEGMKRFELEDLLRASAEMLGKGGYGTAYKAVLDDGNTVTVKRLRDISAGNLRAGVGKREFEQHMDILGRLRHPNLVSLIAFYYARDEKLLVYEYMPNGSLFSLLHGNRGPGRTPLDWTTRLRISIGAARGLAFLHHNHRNISHGNIKSTNVLVDKSGNARISDFGLSLFLGGVGGGGVTPRPYGYRAPESKQSHKGDVYSFGVLLLEILTGKYPSQLAENGDGVLDLPRWVQSVVREEWTAEVFDLELMRYKDIEEEMVGMLQIAMSCTSTVADQRPSMGQVVKMMEEIRGGGEWSSPSHQSFDSVSESASEDVSHPHHHHQ